jgi:hypothetical protein
VKTSGLFQHEYFHLHIFRRRGLSLCYGLKKYVGFLPVPSTAVSFMLLAAKSNLQQIADALNSSSTLISWFRLCHLIFTSKQALT